MTDRNGVLIVEDDLDIREALEAVLVHHGFSTFAAENGEVALDRMRSDATRPYVILLDVVMPVMDGHELHRNLRGDPELCDIPIVLLTAHSRGDDDARAMQADGFLKKPCDRDTLVAMINRFCKPD
ncbi:MAG: response regulator [Deltaproteobacteria bacterium]|nr:response regulator [Deltaproteobacteria bacterium]